jgi:hypothetical protein
MRCWEYGHAVALVLVLAVCALAAFAVGRWWVLGLGPIVVVAAALLGAVSSTGIRDTPALFLGAVVTAACLVGVVLRQHLASPSI